jgi:hypothetical protein
VTNTLDPVTGNLQSSILKVSASGVQTPFATLSAVNFAAEGLAIDRAGNVLSWRLDETSPNFASTIFKRRPQHILHILPMSQTTNLWQIHVNIVCVLFYVVNLAAVLLIEVNSPHLTVADK